MRFKGISLAVFLCCIGFITQAKNISKVITSPSGEIQVTINTDQGLNYSVKAFQQPVLDQASIDLNFNDKNLLKTGKFKNVRTSSVNEKITPVVAFKSKEVENHYNSGVFYYTNHVSVEFRVFDDGVAYRFNTTTKDSVEVNEVAQYSFSDNCKMWSSPLAKNHFASSFEVPYKRESLESMSRDTMTYLPLLMEQIEGVKILMTESNVKDYPNMFLEKTGDHQLSALFPPAPIKTKLVGDRGSKVIEGAEYAAKTIGQRSFPWRLMIITDQDEKIIESNLVYALADENKLKDTQWIKPGKVSWEWWNASNLYDVDFKSGFSTEAYKYYIDFASEYGLEYVLLDEGWSVSTTDLSKSKPELNLPELIRYANSKGVKILLWTTWQTLYKQWFVFDTFEKWGIAGIKVDFMDRADQWMVNFYEKVATEAAKHHLLVDFHGAYKPVGLNRTYPNVVSYEGVHGLEQCKWKKTCNPLHNVTLPFIRMAAGPMDYTPGAMRNFHTEEYAPNWERPGSMGTRCHELALYVVFESGIQMLADSPSNYLKDPTFTEFLSKIPVTWDKTKVLDAKIDNHIVIAREKDGVWYVGGLNAGNSQELTIDLSFLSEGTHKATIVKDGANADHFAEDYKLEKTTLSKNQPLSIKMETEGGFAIRIE